jgi:tetratricopeptide (TPR) repeat protein
LPQALADCDESFRLIPGDADTFNSHALVHLKAGRFAAALADYDSSLKIDPKIASALFGRGVAKRRLNHTSGGATPTSLRPSSCRATSPRSSPATASSRERRRPS